MKIVLIAILGFFYHWVKERKSLEKKTGKKYSFTDFVKEKDDEIIMSIIAIVVILLMLPYLNEAIQVWLNISEGIGYKLLQLIIAFFSGMVGTYIVDRSASLVKKKIKNKTK